MKQQVRTEFWLLAAVALLLGACAPDVPPRSVNDFLEDEIGLEATLARCNENRGQSRSDTECKNAREANKRISAQKEQERQIAMERESQRKLDSIRRRNEAAAEARRFAEQDAERREQEEYEAQFGASSGDDNTVIEPAPTDYETYSQEYAEETLPPVEETTETAEVVEPAASDPQDLDALRQEYNRRASDEPPATETNGND